MENNATEVVSGKTVLQRMADLIANAEFSLQTSKNSQKDIEASLQEKTKLLDQHLRNISSDIRHFREMMTRAGAQQLREETEKLSQEGKKEAKLLENTYRTTKAAIATQCVQLNKASMSTVKNVSQLVSSVRKNHLKKLTEERLGELQQNCETSLQKVHRMVTSLHWRNLVMAVLITVLVATIVSLYVDNAWPWQAHQQILKQREAGKILLNSWQQLSHSDQELIIQNA
ncbi:MAG TPA: hypothetical protein VGV92_02145 [Gammaproteobacteria bacterium]|nr:hypothetical protein [Gammaproteobacteria bacterium]